ncbi:hypothetical protein MADA3029_910084 [Vibrio nigripulchritudo MADA3029]|uniref:Uncharacterized protein n=2 Tax=Vibrio nigripulchritudo TaxID=28173 RepID=U4KDQ1_9VIBR|nr:MULTISPECIES: hypothetical protein [Vibrio]EGU57393.1 hypothetical protein VINI7043_04725 [Vibrio nigripulchritudo ATCC 27043]UAB72603.1 hypothetical protein INR79_25430 [Vibrio sp. SCSIO 43132]CCN36748.1 hypothetical protein VIBNIAM115_440013 [Vibrio nigripulchritudo AM115]CCN44155.1 hypothetical protein VIBNIFTn2_710030 [Vibrio nigripulchritudo FTn2]CCN49934.1 hypothetical protein VIBNIMADA3020_810085 [Vibrio nigripulchritudo MADA3020]
MTKQAKSSDVEIEPQTNGADQLTQIQQLLFGERAESIESAIEELSDKTNQTFIQLEKKLDSINLQIAKLADSLEGLAETSQQNNTSLEMHFTQEVGELSQQLHDKHEEALSKIDSVSEDLRKNKADRKTLATLLSTMADDLDGQ